MMGTVTAERWANQNRWRRANPEKVAAQNRRAHLRRLYGISVEEFDSILAAQGGRCAICRSDAPGGRSGSFAVDHCHDTGRIRGLLCSDCNLGLGKLGDTAEALKRALTYLEGSR